MATVKLTLSAEQSVVRIAKRLARERGMSVSELFSTSVRSLAKIYAERPKEMGPITRQLLGIAKLPKGKTARQTLDEALCEKYGLKK